MGLKIIHFIKSHVLKEFPIIKESIIELHFIESNEMVHHSLNAIVFLMLFHKSINSFELNFNFTSDMYISLGKFHFDKLHKFNQMNSSSVVLSDELSIKSTFLSLILKSLYYIADPNHKVTSKSFLQIFKLISNLRLRHKDLIETEFRDIYYLNSSSPVTPVTTYEAILPNNLEELITNQVDETPLTQQDTRSLLKFINNIKYSTSLKTNDLIILLINLFQDIDDEFINLIQKNEPKSLILMGYAINLIHTAIDTNFLNHIVFNDEIDFILFKLGSSKSAHWKLWLSPLLPR